MNEITRKLTSQEGRRFKRRPSWLRAHMMSSSLLLLFRRLLRLCADLSGLGAWVFDGRGRGHGCDGAALAAIGHLHDRADLTIHSTRTLADLDVVAWHVGRIDGRLGERRRAKAYEHEQSTRERDRELAVHKDVPLFVV